MGQRNIPFSNHMTGFQTEQHSLGYIQAGPCVFYGGFPNFPQPNIHPPVLPAGPTNMLHHHPSHPHNQNGGALFFGMSPYNTFQHPPSNLDLAVSSSSVPFNPYMSVPTPAPVPAPIPATSRDFLIPVNHPQAPFPTAHGFGVQYMEDGRGGSFKRKNTGPGPNPNPNPGSSSSSSGAGAAVQMGVWAPVESEEANSFVPPNEASSMVEIESNNRSVRNRHGIINGSDSVSVLPQNTTHMIAQPFQLPPNPWLSNNGNENNNNNGFIWNQTPLPVPVPALPYLPSPVEMQNYQIPNGNRNSHSAGFMHPQFIQTHHHPNVHHVGPHALPPPMQGVRGHNSLTFPPHPPPTLGTLPLEGGILESGPRYVGPVVPPTGFRIFRPHQRDELYEMNMRNHRSLPHLRVLPEDGVAVFEVPGYHVGPAIHDQHRDMRLDIDGMSYEDLLQLGERIGTVRTGVSEERIASQLKIRTFMSSEKGSTKEASTDQDSDVCVICQNTYKDKEIVGSLECGHDYHADCVKSWLLVKNACPICKATGLNP